MFVFFLQSFILLAKNKQYNECELLQKKNYLPLYFFSTAKHFIIKKNNFTNYLLSSANEKEQITR